MNRSSGIFKRIVKPYFILVTIILSVAFFFVYRSQIEKTKGEAYEAAERIASQTAQFLDSYLDGMNSVAEQVKHQDEITSYFYRVKGESAQKNIFETDIVNGIDISSRLKNLLVGHSPDYSIFILNSRGDFVSSRNYMIDRDATAALLKNGVFDRELMRIKAAGGVLIMPPQKDRWSKSPEEYITLAKELKNDYSDENAGIIEIRALLPEFDSKPEDNSLMIRDRSDNTIIYPAGANPQSGYSYISASLDNAPWEVMLSYGGNIEAALDNKTAAAFVLMYIMLTGGMLLIMGHIGRHICKPITQLSENVRKIALPGEKLAQVDGGIDEIEELEDSFSQMLSRISEASAREKKAYALALQAQMNPHFLYNTLAVIAAQGLEDGNEKVYGMCAGLSDMLRYVAAYESVTVKLSDEINHTKNYLELMKARYEEYFDYSIDVDDNLLDMPVPKLFIQPLAENCFKHGFRDVEPPWHIEIAMHGTRKAWKLRIKDNGSGISPDVVQNILARAEKFSETSEIGSIGGLGTVNTIVRLRLTHNSNTKCIINGDDGAEIIIMTGEDNHV